ncbi:hypothetical protein RchiOBHm_Chr3g0488441 [Rosa chinensis]|uniref:Uncharacterized protein n=1 Tax=Rosa chinensis TaxID=74649 RepID=A0A2P6RFS6_ROSCH|nr:hypothetical protein RchiOBHm_Chr3g0488441 [Rosa chinensis]
MFFIEVVEDVKPNAWICGWLQEHKDKLIEKCKCFLQVWVVHFRGSSAKFLVEFILRWAPQGHFRFQGEIRGGSCQDSCKGIADSHSLS